MINEKGVINDPEAEPRGIIYPNKTLPQISQINTEKKQSAKICVICGKNNAEVGCFYYNHSF